MKNRELFLSGKISNVAWRFAWPSIISMVVFSLYSIVDRVFIGNIPEVGAQAIAGAGLAQPIITLSFALAVLVSAGAGTQISILLGEKKNTKANEVFHSGIKLALVLQLILMILVFILADQILALIGAEPNVTRFAKTYLLITALGCPLQGVTLVMNDGLRATGYPHLPTIANVISMLLNVALDAIFVFGLGWGVAGAAWATIIAQTVCLLNVIGFYEYHRHKMAINLRIKQLKIKLAIITKIIKIGIAPFIMQAVNAFILVLLNSVLLHYGGSLGLAALMIVGSIQGLAFLPIIGYCQGQQPLIGFNYGAQAFARVRGIAKYALGVVFGFGILAMLICQFAAKPIVLLFTQDPKLIEIAATGVQIAMTMAIVVGLQMFMSMYFQFIGKPKPATILTLLRQVVVLIPLVFILPKFFGLNGIWAAWPTADVIVTTVTTIMFLRAYRKLPKQDAVHLNKKSSDKLLHEVESGKILAEDSIASEVTAV